MGECPLCGESTNKPSTRLIKESCGHSKCRLCLLNEESGCSICEGNNGDIPCTIESIGNFDYRLPATTISTYEELHSTPRKLDFNKIPDAFTDCPLYGGKLTIDSNVNQNIDANIPGPEKVDIGTETENFITSEENVQLLPTHENTHSSVAQVNQTTTQPVIKSPQAFTNTISINQQSHQETPIVQNSNFIPVTQRSDGRQFITIAFIANNSPNKNQQVVTPLLNQCLPALSNISVAQRPAASQCIPVLGNINTLQNGNQFIIRSPNVVQNLVGNQSVPVIGNLNTLQNLAGNQTLSIVGDVNAVKNLVGNQPMPALTAISSLQTPVKGQSLSSAISPNVAHNVVGNHPYQVTQTVPKPVEEQSAPIEENVTTPRKQVRTRGLPRIKNVKNVNIVQKSATSQSDTVNSQIDKSPAKGKRQRRKELPVYLIPSKPPEQKKSPPTKSPAQVAGYMSPGYQLEDFLLFNKQNKTSETLPKNSDIQAETMKDTQTIKKPSESVINEAPIVSDQINCTVIEEKYVENKLDEFPEEAKVTNNEQSTKDVSIETNVCSRRQDLNVVFNIRDAINQPMNKENEDGKEKINIPNGESSNKEEFPSLDTLFEIIEKESNKLNGGMFGKGEKSDLNVISGFDYEDNQKMQNQINDDKEQNLNNDIYDEHGESPILDCLNKKIDEDVSRNSHDINHDQEENVPAELCTQNGESEKPNGEAHTSEETNSNEEIPNISNIEMKRQENESDRNKCQTSEKLGEEACNNQEKRHIFNREINCQEEEEERKNLNDEADNEGQVQSLYEMAVGAEKESDNQTNQEEFLEKESNQQFDKGIIMPEEENSRNDNIANGYTDNNRQCPDENKQRVYENISDEERDNEPPRETSVEEEGAILHQNEETWGNLALDIVKDSPAFDRGDSACDKLDVGCRLMNDSQSLEEKPAESADGKERKARKKKLLLCDDEVDRTRGNATPGNSRQLIVKKPRGRPRKSISNIEQPDETSCSEETEQAIGTDAPTDVDEKLNVIAERHVFEVNVQVHNPETEININSDDKKPREMTKANRFLLDVDRQENNVEIFRSSELTIIKKARGRAKKSLPSMQQSGDSREDEISIAPEEDQQSDGRTAQEAENQIWNADVFREEAATSLHTDNQTAGSLHTKQESSVLAKKPRGRPRKSSSSCGQLAESEVSDSRSIGRRNELFQQQANESNIVQGAELSSAIKKPRGRARKSPSIFEAETGMLPGERNGQYEAGESSTIAEKPSRRPRKSRSSLEQLFVEAEEAIGVKKPRGRPRKSLTPMTDQSNVFLSEASELSSLSGISNPRQRINDKEISNDKKNAVAVKKARGRPRKSLSTNNDQRPKVNGEEGLLGAQVTNTDDQDQDQVFEDSMINEARPRKACSSYEPQSQLEVSNTSVEPAAAVLKKPRGRPKKSVSNAADTTTELEHSSEHKPSSVLVDANATEQASQQLTIVRKVAARGRPKKALLIKRQEVDERSGSAVGSQGNCSKSMNNATESDVNRIERPCSEIQETESSEDLVLQLCEETKAASGLISERNDSRATKAQDDENKENKKEYGEEKSDNVAAVVQEQDDTDNKPNEADEQVCKNNTTGRTYNKFDKLNTQLIVENGKRKRKPKVLLYENEDLDVSPLKKKRKQQLNKSSCRNDDCLNEMTVERPEHRIVEDATENLASSTRDEESRGSKRTRRPKTLLYENEDLGIGPKCTKKPKVEHSRSASKDSKDRNSWQGQFSAEGDCTSLQHLANLTNERMSKATTFRNNAVKAAINKEDLETLRRFDIRLQPVVVLQRNIDSSTIVAKRRPRGRPKLPNHPSQGHKVFGSKLNRSAPGKEKRPRGRPSLSHIATLPGEPPTYLCTICEQTFKIYSHRAFHSVCAASNHKTFKCELCPKQFYHKSHLEYHERMHKSDKPFACNLCGKKFVQKSKLNRHLLVHKYLQDFECNECGKTFPSKDYLKSHLRSHLQSSFVYRCNQCPKSFKAESLKKRHELSHAPVPLFKCLHCPKSYKTKFELDRHLKIHQKARPFACHQCGKTFLNKFEVRRHIATHSGAKNYTCNHCEQHFGRIDNYKRHMLHHHSLAQDIAQPNSCTTVANAPDPSNAENKQENQKDKSSVKPKKLSKTASNTPPARSINFIQPLTPQVAPSPYSVLPNHHLASVIRETLPDMNNAVPVISAPTSAQPPSSFVEPIPLEQALVLNRQIEDKIYTQTSFCEFPGLTRRTSATLAERKPSFTFARRTSSEGKANSSDGTSFLPTRQGQTPENRDDDVDSPKKDIHVHWRRRTAETFKSKVDENN